MLLGLVGAAAADDDDDESVMRAVAVDEGEVVGRARCGLSLLTRGRWWEGLGAG